MKTIENLLKNDRKVKGRPRNVNAGQRKAMGRHKGSKMEARVKTNVCNNTVEQLASALSAKSAMLKLLADTGALSRPRESVEVKRWKPFAAFQRKVKTATVMSAPSGIIKDLLPGFFVRRMYHYDDYFMFRSI